MDKNIYWVFAIKNTITMLAWIAIAIIFGKWWIALFSALFMSTTKTKTRYYRFCDKCGKRSPVAETYNEALDKAKEAGWIHYVESNKDYCPDCQKLLKEEL